MNKIDNEHIEALMGRITVTTEFSELPTPHVTAKAWVDESFLLETAISKSVDPALFSRELGEKYSTEEVIAKSRDKLWLLEGWRLYIQLSDVNYQREKYVDEVFKGLVEREKTFEDYTGTYGCAHKIKLKNGEVIQGVGYTFEEAQKDAAAKYLDYFNENVKSTIPLQPPFKVGEFW